MTETRFELTVVRKANSLPLTKRLSLAPDGRLASDGSACVMASGTAWRFHFGYLDQLAELIVDFGSDQALTLGGLRAELPTPVEVVTKRKLNGSAAQNVIARTAEFITYRPGEPALALIDYDQKGMPPQVADKVAASGGFWPALVSIMPLLAETARLARNSTSSGLYRTDNGDRLAGPGGAHVFLGVTDGSDIERFLRALHARCWLAGLGWYMVGAAGQLLERSIVDRVVGAPEHLVFEGAPVLVPPLAQDEESRQPLVVAGRLLDTNATCADLTIVEQARLKELRVKEATRLKGRAAEVRRAYVAERAEKLATRAGLTLQQAAAVIEHQCQGILLPDVVLPFDDADLAGSTVGDVLADPDRFVDATLADPLEGVEYGAGKAKVLRRANGVPCIHSFAHGSRKLYSLQYDYSAAEAAIKQAKPGEAADTFVRCVLASPSSLDPGEVEELRNLANEISKLGKRTLDRMLKEARITVARQQHQEELNRQAAERRDPRPQLDLPFGDDEWLPVMAILNEVLGSVRDSAPPARDPEDDLSIVRSRHFRGLHLLSTEETNPDEQS